MTTEFFLTEEDNGFLTDQQIADTLPPTDKEQAFLRDKRTPGLGVRITAAGTKSFIFQSKKSGRKTIGRVGKISLEKAREEAIRIKSGGSLPSPQVYLAAHDVWERYVDNRKQRWCPSHTRNHVALSKPGRVIGKLLARTIDKITPEVIRDWLLEEGARQLPETLLGYRLLKPFFAWCVTNAVISQNPITPEVRASVPKKASTRPQPLALEEIPRFLGAIRGLKQPYAAFFECLLLTGVKPSQLQSAQWKKIEHLALDDWNTFPLAKEFLLVVESLLHRGNLVFSKDGLRPLSNATIFRKLERVCKDAGIRKITVEEISRSLPTLLAYQGIKTISDWQDHWRTSTAGE
ncbi:putative Phage integrase [Gammaproteobacteria bacterium]